MKILKFVCAATMCIVALGSFAQSRHVSKSHSRTHRDLMAKQSTGKDNIKMGDNSFIQLMDEQEPEPDIYTEGWNSRSVNPFKESQVPDREVLNVRGYHTPHPGRVSSPYGYRARFGRMHKGVDISLKLNDTIYAAYDGKVRLTNYEPKGYGNYIILRHPNKLETVYGHLNKILVKPNQVVKAGQPIGLGGSTGRSTGPHLHFETRFMGYAINPAAIINFSNGTVHTDTYTFSKQTYQQPRNFTPNDNKKKVEQSQNRYQAATTTETYTVKRGDSVGSIARAYGISTTTLRRLNNMSSTERITIGQVLKVK
ncbi:MAG: peptidoglycan DD-metalloendopeptidase family protein [Porphyromonadaceae bacterium]|nr:peptidoglycan DD-metalloendopeptidase family protein [Porphyromonadaceae bacterium]